VNLNRKPSCEDVLDAFAVEPQADHETLERYLRTYPDYADDLIDLSRELNRRLVEDDTSLSSEDSEVIDAAWKRHALSGSSVQSDPFARLSAEDMRNLAHLLEVPRQVIAAFRERRVIVSSVPRGFLNRLADAIRASIKDFQTFGSLPVTEPTFARSYKAHAKPIRTEPVTFEQLLCDAGVTKERRIALMMDVD